MVRISDSTVRTHQARLLLDLGPISGERVLRTMSEELMKTNGYARFLEQPLAAPIRSRVRPGLDEAQVSAVMTTHLPITSWNLQLRPERRFRQARPGSEGL